MGIVKACSKLLPMAKGKADRTDTGRREIVVAEMALGPGKGEGPGPLPLPDPNTTRLQVSRRFLTAPGLGPAAGKLSEICEKAVRNL